MKKDWRGILKIIEVEHVRDGSVVWSDRNIRNILHAEGELFMLSCCFANDGLVVPGLYYFGLDARSSVAVTDTMADVAGEPSGNGYARQSVSSNGGFSVVQQSGIYRAVPSVVTFTASGGGYGPMRNLFLTNMSDNSGYLISTATLSSPVTFTAGDAINLRMSIQLADISV